MKLLKYPVILNRNRRDRVKYAGGSCESVCDEVALQRDLQDMYQFVVLNMVESGEVDMWLWKTGYLIRVVLEGFQSAIL